MKEWISLIPKKIHIIWIGKLDPPDYYEKYFKESFEKNMSQFEIKLWRNKDLTKKNFPLTWKYIQIAKKIHGKKMYDEDGNQLYDKECINPLKENRYAQITDLMRLEIIYRNGGFYFDINFEILKPMYNVLNKKKKFIGCNEIPRFKNEGSLSNSFFGAVKHSVILKRLLSKKYLDGIDFSNDQVSTETGPGYLRMGIKSNDSYLILPTKYMYPFIEPFDSYTKHPPYRKSKKNKCHSLKRKKKTKKLSNKKGYIRYPCKKYPKSYALKHWELGKSWLTLDTCTFI
jgi:hypothetical protein